MKKEEGDKGKREKTREGERTGEKGKGVRWRKKEGERKKLKEGERRGKEGRSERKRKRGEKGKKEEGRRSEKKR